MKCFTLAWLLCWLLLLCLMGHRHSSSAASMAPSQAAFALLRSEIQPFVLHINSLLFGTAKGNVAVRWCCSLQRSRTAYTCVVSLLHLFC